jgi:hypothetical protein
MTDEKSFLLATQHNNNMIYKAKTNIALINHK